MINHEEFKCQHCKVLINTFNIYYCGSQKYFSCPNCKTDILTSRSFNQTLSSDLNIHRVISKLYDYNDKEIEWVEIDENKELRIEYKIIF